jgi:nicotinamide mononucleotide transporter
VNAVTAADWTGSTVAALSIVALFRKSLWYWYLSIVATTLWFYVFVETDSAMAAGLQLSYIFFALYGIARWHLDRRGRRGPPWLDQLGTLVALAILGGTAALTDFGDRLAYIELGAVALAILANWLTAMKIVWCWPIWISTNVLFGVLFWHLELWGLFGMQWLYAALSVIGFRAWRREAPTPAPARA